MIQVFKTPEAGLSFAIFPFLPSPSALCPSPLCPVLPSDFFLFLNRRMAATLMGFLLEIPFSSPFPCQPFRYSLPRGTSCWSRHAKRCPPPLDPASPYMFSWRFFSIPFSPLLESQFSLVVSLVYPGPVHEHDVFFPIDPVYDRT